MVLLKPWVWIRLLSKRTRDDKEVGRKLDLNFPGGAVIRICLPMQGTWV